MTVNVDGGVSVVDIYRVVGSGSAEIRPPASGWPSAVKMRLHGFRDLRSVEARAGGRTLDCKPEDNRFMSQSYECKYSGSGAEHPRAEGDYVEVQLPQSLLAADGAPVEIHWSERGL
jgi:hypothetical protein